VHVTWPMRRAAVGDPRRRTSTAWSSAPSWLAYVGDNLYEFTLKLNRHLNHLRGRLGLPYWSLSAAI
jgi:hypothetical protein